MAKKDRLEKIKSQFEKLRKDSLETVTSANRIVYEGVQKLADRELKALNDYYRSALLSIKRGQKSGDSFKDIAQKQIELLQDTAQKLLANARDSLGVIAKTRAELAALVDKSLNSGSISAPDLAQITKPAQQAVKDLKKAAAKARKQVDKIAKQAGAKATEVKASVSESLGSVLDIKPAAIKPKSVSAKPSPASRANQATSKAKRGGSTVPPKRGGSTVPPKRGGSTVPPKKRGGSTVPPTK